MREDGVRGKSLYLPFESSVNLKVLFKKKKLSLLKKKGTKKETETQRSDSYEEGSQKKNP